VGAGPRAIADIFRIDPWDSAVKISFWLDDICWPKRARRIIELSTGFVRAARGTLLASAVVIAEISGFMK
jgi:hypothetical protein